MKIKTLTLLLIIISKFGIGQYQEYESQVTPYLSDSIQSGFFYFKTPNSFQPGDLYQIYKYYAPDLLNDMELTDVHTDSLIGFRHYKYQQLYKNIPVEAAGCIEHFDENGMLQFLNAKIADSIKADATPNLSADEAIKKLIRTLQDKDPRIKFAWNSEKWEQQARLDYGDSSATWRPDAELIWAIDEVKDVRLVIPGSRFTLAYKIPITTIDPFETINY